MGTLTGHPRATRGVKPVSWPRGGENNEYYSYLRVLITPAYEKLVRNSPIYIRTTVGSSLDGPPRASLKAELMERAIAVDVAASALGSLRSTRFRTSSARDAGFEAEISGSDFDLRRKRIAEVDDKINPIPEDTGSLNTRLIGNTAKASGTITAHAVRSGVCGD